MNGRSPPSMPVDHSLIWASVVSSVPILSVGGAEMDAAVGGDRVGAVVARPEGQAGGGVEDVEAGVGGHRGGDAEDGGAVLLEDERRRHQAHRRMVEDEEGGDRRDEDQDEEKEAADHAGDGLRGRRAILSRPGRGSGSPIAGRRAPVPALSGSRSEPCW